MKTLTKKRISNKKVDTWLPLFSGFYGTIWETDNDEKMEIEWINEQRQEKNLSPIEWDDVDWDYDEYTSDVIKGMTREVGDELIKLKMIDGYKLQKLVSPREYNFRNDSINVEFTLSKENVKNIQRYLEENKEAFSKYLKYKYTSCDGFISFYSNMVGDWMDDLEEVTSHQHKLGSILQFILKNENQIDEYFIHDHLSGNGVMIHATNYSKLIGEQI